MEETSSLSAFGKANDAKTPIIITITISNSVHPFLPIQCPLKNIIHVNKQKKKGAPFLKDAPYILYQHFPILYYIHALNHI